MGEPTDPQRWWMAVGAPLAKRNGRRLDRLGGDGRPTVSWEASSVLRKGWSVRTGQDAARSVTWLLEAGHRAEFERSGLGSARSFAGWDAERVANVAGWAYAAYLVDLETAWDWHRRAVALVRESFASWAEFGQSYVAGLRTWSRGDASVVAPSEQAVAWLLSDPTSPWVTLPFDLPFDDVPPPDLTPNEVVVSEGEAVTIADAIRLAGPDGRVILPAGSYREHVAPEHAVEIVARGEVVLESAGLPCVRIEGTRGVLLRGLTLRSQHTADGKSLNTVRVNRGYARIEGCDIAASHDGVQVATWGAAHVVDSSIHDCGSVGLNLLGGQLIAEDCSIRGGKKSGVELGGEAGGLIERCTIERNAGAGVLAHGKVDATVLASSFSTNGGSSSVVGAGASRLSIDDVTITGSLTGGVFFQESASGVVSHSRIEGCALAALDVGSSELVEGHGLQIAGNASSGVIIRNGARLLLTRSALDDSAQGHVWVMADAFLALAECRIARGALALWVQGGGEALVHDCHFEDQAGAAIDAQPQAQVRLGLCRIEGPETDGILVGEGAAVEVASTRVTRTGGAGLRVSAGGRASLDTVTFEGCAAGDVIGDSTIVASSGTDDERAERAAAAFDQRARERLG